MKSTVLSCFSGVGGLDLGLEYAGFDTIGCLEINRDAREALATNRPRWSLLEPLDVIEAGRALKPSDVGMVPGELTLIAGGPPCQPFSMAAQWAAPRPGIMDARGTAVGGMLELVRSFLPAAVMMENVAGFLSGRNNAAPVIEAAFEEINAASGTDYRLGRWIVDAADYGVPQNRKRAIVLAFRDGHEILGSLPASHEGMHRTAWDALGDYAPEDAPVALGKYADLLPSIPEGFNYQYLTAKGAGPDREVFGYRTKYWSFLLKLAKDRPAWTLPASPGPSTGPFHWDNRPLSALEMLLLQGFPPSWKLVGSERASVRLAGNATPPPLAEAVGRIVLSVLERPESKIEPVDIKPALAVARRDVPAPPPAEPSPLPPRWAALVGPRKAHPGPGYGPSPHRVSERDAIDERAR